MGWIRDWRPASVLLGEAFGRIEARGYEAEKELRGSIQRAAESRAQMRAAQDEQMAAVNGREEAIRARMELEDLAVADAARIQELIERVDTLQDQAEQDQSSLRSLVEQIDTASAARSAEVEGFETQAASQKRTIEDLTQAAVKADEKELHQRSLEATVNRLVEEAKQHDQDVIDLGERAGKRVDDLNARLGTANARLDQFVEGMTSGGQIILQTRASSDLPYALKQDTPDGTSRVDFPLLTDANILWALDALRGVVGVLVPDVPDDIS